MTPIWVDLFALGALALFVTGGYRLGLVAAILAWAGLALGIVAGGATVSAIFDKPTSDNPSEGFIFALLIVLVLAFIGQSVGVLGGNALRSKINNGRVRRVDAITGAIAGLIIWAMMFWVVFPAISDHPGSAAKAIRGSKVAQFLDTELPDPPNVLGSLQGLFGTSGFPEVFDALRPAPKVPNPPKNSPLTAEQSARVQRSTVQVIALACENHLQEGSGFFIQGNVVVTNAHVIAGGSRIAVLGTDGVRHSATVLAFDPNRDLALLSTGSYFAQPLQLQEAKLGEHVAIFGHPGGQQALRIAAGSVADRVNALGRDIYGENKTTRSVLVMAASLRQGDSGSGVVNKDGVIVGITFAIAPDKPNVSYALDVQELKDLLAQKSVQRSTGSCISD